MYDTMFSAALDEDRLPKEAEQVLKDMIERFQNSHNDSELQVRSRHLAYYRELKMRKGQSHFDFQAEFETHFKNMERDGVIIDRLQLRDEYLHKIHEDLRIKVVEYNMMKEIEPKTWKDIADTVEKILKVRLAIPNRQPKNLRTIQQKNQGKTDSMQTVSGGSNTNYATCNSCGGVAHTKGLCPNKLTASEVRLESMQAAQEAGSKPCKQCGGIGHRLSLIHI